MEYNIVAKETEFKGILFRSRLEARWAAFFELAGFEWEYEPFDLDGWTPDFRLKGENEILVEVKPIESVDRQSFYKAIRTANYAEVRPRVACIGLNPFVDFDAQMVIDDWGYDCGMNAFGYCDNEPRDGERYFICKDYSGTLDIGIFAGGVWSSLRGVYFKEMADFVGCPATIDFARIRALWVDACNLTRYEPRR